MTAFRSAECFCTYDVRAKVTPETFDAQTYTHLATAFLRFLEGKRESRETPPVIAIGYDARLHSPELFAALKKSLLEGGATVIDTGLQPSPMVYAMEFLDLPEGIPTPEATLVVTASHNPAPDNGLKWTLKQSALTAAEVLEIKAIFEALQTENSSPAKASGTCYNFNPLEAYIAWSRERLPNFEGKLKVVVDAGNGTGGLVSLPLHEALDIETIPLFTEPDGHFPNHHPDPSKAKYLVALGEKVRETSADFGIAFDGDSDRIGVVDDKGRHLPNDFLLLFLTESMMKAQQVAGLADDAPRPKVVGEVKCSQHMFEGITQLGAEALMSPTGHAYIKQLMKAEKAVLGGEVSGHFFFKDEHWGFDDAFYAAVRVCRFLKEARETAGVPDLTLSTLVDALPPTVLSEELRYKVERSQRPQIMKELESQLRQLDVLGNQRVLELSTLDGLRVALVDGFALVRTSNTEPVLTLRWEAANDADLEALETVLLRLVNQAIEAAQMKSIREKAVLN